MGTDFVVHLPYLSDVVCPSTGYYAYGIYTSQIIRYARVCSEAVDFMERVKILFGKLVKKGYEKTKLKKTLRRCLHKYPWISKKYENINWLELL